jgi:hypothetical protein
MKFLLQVTNNFVHAFDDLLDMYQQIGEQINLLEKYQSLFENKPHMRRVLEMIYIDILDFHAKALSYFRQKSINLSSLMLYYGADLNSISVAKALRFNLENVPNTIFGTHRELQASPKPH